jgi:uncharacterized membrane protein YphA (DoxX/SURF4 family)
MPTIARVFLGLTFMTAGLGKLFAGHHFPGFIGPVHLQDELAPYGLALYARFVGYCQVFIGTLLLTRRFAAIGAVMLVPMLANILMVTISLGWRGTPWLNACLLGLNLYLVWHERARWIGLLRSEPSSGSAWVVCVGLTLVLVGPLTSRWSMGAAYGLVAAGLAICARSGRAS